MKLYSTGEIAAALNVSVGSIRNWTAEPALQPYLSNSATRTGPYRQARERSYTENDLYVMNTVHKHKTRMNTWDDVAAMLEADELDTTLPSTAALIFQPTAAESFADSLVLRQQLIAANQTIERLGNELREARAESAEQVKSMQQEAREREAELHRAIGRLEAQVEMLREQLNSQQRPDGDSPPSTG